MIQLAIRNKWISFRGSSIVRDLNEKDVLKVQGKFWTVTYKKFIQTLDGETVYIIINKFWKLFAYRAYVIDAKTGAIAATIRRKVFSLHDRYFMETKYGKVEITGNILGFEYHIYLEGKEIGHVARRISLRDSFVLTLEDDNTDIFFWVGLVIAIDNITDERNSNSY